MASQPSTQPVKVAKRQTTLLSFFKKDNTISKSPTTTDIILAPPVAENPSPGVVPQSETPNVRRALDLCGDQGEVVPCGASDSDSEDDIPLSLVLSRSSSSLPTLLSSPKQHDVATSKAANNATSLMMALHSVTPHHNNAPTTKLTQSTLDFGQSISSTTECPRCGMVYASHHATDEAVHQRTCRAMATARSGQSQRAFVEDLFAGCEDARDDKNTQRAKRQRPPAEEHPRRAHTKPRNSGGTSTMNRRSSGNGNKTLLQHLQTCVAVTSSIRLLSLPPSPRCTASIQRFAVAVMDGNDAHVWSRLCPAVVDHLVKPPMSIGATFAWLADSRRLAAKDAASDESYAEHRTNVRIVVVLDNDRGAPLAAVVGRETFREVELNGNSSSPSSRARTRCDVLQLWCVEEDELPIETDSTCAAVSRASYLFESVLTSVAGPQTTFWNKFKKNADVADTVGNAAVVPPAAPPTSSLTAPEAALLCALEVLGKHIVYGCHVNWIGEMCYAQDIAHHPSLAVCAEDGSMLPSFDWAEESEDVDPDSFRHHAIDSDDNDVSLDGTLQAGDDESCANSSTES